MNIPTRYFKKCVCKLHMCVWWWRGGEGRKPCGKIDYRGLFSHVKFTTNVTEIVLLKSIRLLHFKISSNAG